LIYHLVKKLREEYSFNLVTFGLKSNLEIKDSKVINSLEQLDVAHLESKRQKRRFAAGLAAVAKADCEPKRFVREFRGPTEGLEVGQELCVDVFAKIKSVDVIGTSKGRGTAGVMKRHNFHGQRASHGVKKCHRHAGGTGCSASPSRVFKGKKMAGRYGAARCSVRNLQVVQVDVDNNLLIVRGAIPGPNGGYVVISQTNKLG
jgi:large subunit ribosomal protein L3